MINSKYINIIFKSLISSLILLQSGCDSSTEPKTIHGCLDSQACNYNPSATLDNNSCEYLDNCDVCDNDPTNDCGQDCAGVWGGTATLDDCGVCSGGSTGHDSNNDDLGCGCFNPGPLTYCFDGDDDSQGSIGSGIEYCLQDLPNGWVIDCTDEDDSCMSNIYDCFDDCSGNAFIDDCGECVSGNTNLIENFLMDCAGVCYGTYYLDECGFCDDNPNNDCFQDCNGEWGGEAFLDECNICSGGSSGHFANSDQDCAGECFGSLVEDCTGTCNGFALIDDCGICDDNSENDNSEMDCSGECFGSAYINNCENCVGGNTGLNENNCTVSDIDGNVYSTIIIGNQEWMAENLKVTHYRNGDPIPNVHNNNEWVYLNNGAYSIYDNNQNNVDVFGLLYNWYAVNDDRDICTDGWKVPSDDEYMELERFLGMSEIDVQDMGHRGTNEGSKLAGNANLWDDGALKNNNEFGSTGFNSIPSGYRTYHNGTYHKLGSECFFWTSTEGFTPYVLYRIIGYNYSSVYRGDNYKQIGFSVRCIRDSE
ncbi:MAG: hypothetical protein HOG05_03025 [Bacteroidetes bacterium]|jgi:uncharacterized protein (TIGR02145 family)|nr:hypothetical protein [Bacteroidota bacterium]MBT4851324.1 hypothetical protein [Candidatus Neomarinimicrobiota bacterium]MBT5528800.1 hypothetical protein [Cytophagia bacterium]